MLDARDIRGCRPVQNAVRVCGRIQRDQFFRLDELLAQLAGCDDVWIDPRREEYFYGRFAWVRDPDGNRIELWEPT